MTKILLLFIFASLTINFWLASKINADEADMPAALVITDVCTDLARYNPGQTVRIDVLIHNGSASDSSGSLTIYCKRLGVLLKSPAPEHYLVDAGKTVDLTFKWLPPLSDYRGYSVEAWARDSSGATVDNRNTAVDVSSHWTRFPRYGYLANFGMPDPAIEERVISQLKDYHINAIQYYDVEFRSDKPLAGTVAIPAESWPNLEGKPIYRKTLLGLISSAHKSGIASMQYNAIYSAYDNYAGDGVDQKWGMFKDPQHAVQLSLQFPSAWRWASNDIYVFNPGDAGWQNYIDGREKEMLTAYPFDGWHADQFGDYGPMYTYDGVKFDPWRTFAPFIKTAKERLNKTIIFNNVGAYGMYDTCANSGEDAVYVECWEASGQNNYSDLKSIIDQGVSWSKGKAVILAAYNDRAVGDTFSNDHPGQFNTPGVLLTDATIFSSGGSHIELGDDLHMLHNEYFLAHKLLPSAHLLRSLRDYYDFQVAYENLLQGGLLPSANKTKLSIAASSDGMPNTVWVTAKSENGCYMINLVNLLGENSSKWRDDNGTAPEPAVQSNIDMRFYCDTDKLSSIQWASPDTNHGKLYELPFTKKADADGTFAEFTIPSLLYWDMLYLTTN